MHIIKSTFWTRKGQFQKDKNSEAFGIARVALEGDGAYVCQIEGRGGHYRADKEAIKDFISERSFWTSQRGKTTAIVPLFLFELVTERKIKEQPML